MAKRKLALQASFLVAFVGFLGALIATEFFGGMPKLQAQAPANLKPLEKPPAGQTYIGSKECSSCHFDQFMQWRGTKHAKGFDILPAKYQEDKTCLKCHSTGFGVASGFESKAKTAGLAGTTCEACHGPGSEHAKVAKTFAKEKPTKEQKDFISSHIYKIQPKNVCIECHLPQSHKEHPKFDK